MQALLGRLPPALALVAAGWVSVACALTDYALYRDTSALWLLTAGLVVVALAAVRLAAPEPAPGEGTISGALLAALGVGLGLVLPAAGTLYATGTASTWVHHLHTVAAALALLTAAVQGRRLRLLLFGAVGVVMAVGGGLTVHASPAPAIDVWYILQGGARSLLHGRDLFTACWPGNTDPLTTCVYPYMPWTTVSQLPAYLLTGDVRPTYVVAMSLSAVLVWRLAGPRWGPVLGVLLLATPRWFLLLEQTWTEPLLLLGLTVMLWGALTGRSVWAVIGYAFALACKQHLVILLPLAWVWPRFGPRRTLAALGLAALMVLPFAIHDPRAFYDDVVSFHLHLVPRADSLSFYGLATRHGVDLPFVLVPAVTLAVLVAVLVVVPRTDTGFVVGAALLLLAFNIVNKATFFNHVALVLWLLVLALVTEVRRAQSAPEDSSARPGPEAFPAV